MGRIKRLEEKLDELEKKCADFMETCSACKWLIDHPSGVAYNVAYIPTMDRIQYGTHIDHILMVDYFDNRYNRVVSFTPIRSHGEIDVKTVSFDRLNGELEIVFVKGEGKNRTYYDYKKDMYHDNRPHRLRIDLNCTGDWKDITIYSPDSSCVTIP